MQLRKTLDWIEPLSMASGIPANEDKWVLLYSGLNHGFTGKYSILALRANDEITASNFDKLATKLTSNKSKFANAWLGYLGYGLKDCLEKLPADSPSKLDFPDLWLVNYRIIIVFDHVERKVEVWGETEEDLRYIPKLPVASCQLPDIKLPVASCRLPVENLTSNMTKTEYLQKVDAIKEAIRRGDLYQANLTRKFNGTLNWQPATDNWQLFFSLCKISPAPYSAFLKFGDKYIISSSPERFLHIDESGQVDTRPIKGSAPRFADKNEDEKSRIALQNSEKDRAENLMIVDLSRNDLSRGCVPGSVRTENLFEVTSYATVHHMASTVKGQKREDVTTPELIKGCFPPGSMTGAPKIKAMQLCTELEKLKRGVYSGSIGWFGGDGSADLSVVIRTLIIDGNNFEFQVGGAITADSDPEMEWQETLTKAKGIALALGVGMKKLEEL